MKFVRAIVLWSLLAFAAGCDLPKTSYITTKATVIKVYSCSDAGYNYCAYVVDRGGKEIIISDVLARTPHKVGDTIEYMEQKMDISSNKIMSFTLMN